VQYSGILLGYFGFIYFSFSILLDDENCVILTNYFKNN
jgi:hypothetical protein